MSLTSFILKMLLFCCFQFILFMYLFLAVLGLRCCVQAFSSCGEQGLLFVALCRLLIAVASLLVEHGLQAHRFSSCGSWTLERRLSSCGTRDQLLCSMWDIPRPVSLALASGFLATAPPGKSYINVLMSTFYLLSLE